MNGIKCLMGARSNVQSIVLLLYIRTYAIGFPAHIVYPIAEATAANENDVNAFFGEERHAIKKRASSVGFFEAFKKILSSRFPKGEEKCFVCLSRPTDPSQPPSILFFALPPQIRR